MRLSILALLGLALLFAACGPGASREGVVQAGPWDTKTVFAAGAPLVACGVGDVDAARPGVEIVVGVRDGRVLGLHRREDVWESEELLRLPGEIVDLVVEDVLAETKGPEIVVLERTFDAETAEEMGRVHVLRRQEDAWIGEAIGSLPASTASLLVGDVHPDGGTADIVAFGPALAVWTRSEDGWKSELEETWRHGEADERVQGAVVGQAGVLFRATDDPIVYAYDLERVTYHAWPAGSFASFIIEQNRRTHGPDWRPPLKYAVRHKWICFGTVGAAQTSVALGHPGLLFGCEDGTLRRLDPGGTSRIVHRGQSALRHVLYEDVDPKDAGRETAVASDDGTITLLHQDERSSLVLLRDAGRIRDLACAEITRAGRGREIVAVGDAGRVTLSERVR